MTVKEMIEELSKFPEEAKLMVPGYEGGIQLAAKPKLVMAKYEGRRRYMGDYDYNYGLEDTDNEYRIEVVLIPR